MTAKTPIEGMGETMALVYESPVVECPACGCQVVGDRMLGVRSIRGTRWLTFRPHEAPCGLRCAAGGVAFVGRVGRRLVHRGPKTCPKCTAGTFEVEGDVAIVDEGGLQRMIEVVR